MIAFSVGLSCFVLSLNLMRRLKNEAGDLLQLAREENEERRDDVHEYNWEMERMGIVARSISFSLVVKILMTVILSQFLCGQF